MSALPSVGQQDAAPENPYRHEIFELPGGPSGNAVNCIVQGPQGFLWFGGHAGLYRYDGYRFKLYKAIPDDTTSLVFSYVEYLLWTHDGYLWVGTYGGGVFRFNPQDDTFIRYQHDPDDPSSLNDDHVTYLLEDSEKQLWVGTISGLNRMDRTSGQFERYESDDNDPASLSHANVRCIYEDRQGTLWIGTGFVYDEDPALQSKGGLNRFNRDTGTFTRYQHDPEDPESMSGNPVKVIYEDSHGNFWIGCVGGLNKMDRRSGTFEHMLDDPARAHNIYAPGVIKGETSIVHSMLEDQSGNLWLFTLHVKAFIGSAAKVDLSTGHMEIIWERADFVPWQTMQAADGSIWMAGAGATSQVVKIGQRKSLIEHLPASLGLQQQTLEITYEGLLFQGDSVAWAKYHSAHDGSLVLRRFDATTFGSWRDYSHPEVKLMSPDDATISYISLGQRDALREGVGLVLDTDGRIWGCTGDRAGGIFRFDPITNEVKQYLHDSADPQSPPDNKVFFLMADRHGGIWLGGNNAISRLDPVHETFVHYRHDPNRSDSPESGPKLALFEDREGYIWAGGCTGVGEASQLDNPTLNRLDPVAGTVDRIKFSPHLQGTPVTAISQSPTGDILFVMLGRCLAAVFNWHLHDESAKVERWSWGYGGRLFDNVNNLITDTRGIHWLTRDVMNGSDNRIVRFDSETGSAIEFETPTDLKFYARRTFNAPDGRLFLHHQSGLLALDDSGMTKGEEGLQKPYVRFTDLLLNGQPLTPGKDPLLDKPVWEYDKLKFPNTRNSFGLRFSTMDFSRTENCEYDARLLPIQEEWRRIVGEPVVNFFELPPGSYTLEVRGSNSHGIWSEQAATLQIHVALPWRKSTMAFVLYGLSAILGIWLVVRWRYGAWLNQRAIREQEAEARRLKELDALKTRLYTNITHEFRTPLTVISGMASQIKENPKEWFSEGLAMIQRNSNRLLDLVNQMLDLSKLESGKMVLHLQQDDMVNFLKYIVQSFHSFASKKEVQLHFHAEEDQVMMDFDREKMQQVMTNLLSNAVKFTPEGGHIYVRSEWKDLANLKITVRDTGPGISKEEVVHIFDRFYQVDDTPTRHGEGTGIGLALVKELVRLMDGEISVKSKPEKGTEFTLLLPVRQSTALHPSVPESAAVGSAHPASEAHNSLAPTAGVVQDAQRPQVLLIEDNADVVAYIVSCLQDDYHIVVGKDGQEGVEIAIDDIPDLIITDVMMPHKDGFEVCRELKSDARTSHIPIIILTAKADIESKLEGLELGADAYLAKPFHKKELQLRIKKLLELRKTLRAHYLTVAGLTEGASIIRDTPPMTGLEDDFVRKARETVEAHLDDFEFSVEQLGRAMTLSHSQLHRKLVALTGYSAGKFIRYIRLSKAKEMLQDPEMSITAVAFDTGFNDPNYFGRVFKQEIGVTPTEWKEKMLQ